MNHAGPKPWTVADSRRELQRIAQQGTELLVMGGGITGAGVLRDAAQRGMSAALVEAGDFAGGTSSATSKMIHGGLRYLAEGQLAVTRQSCVERDRLRELNPNLVRDLPFLFCSFDDGVPPWQVRAGLMMYAILAGGIRAGFGGKKYQLLKPTQVNRWSRDLRRNGLRKVGLYFDAQVDDARFVLEVIKAARRDQGIAIPHAAVVGFEHDSTGRLIAARVQDQLSGEEWNVGAKLFVNATGPGVDRVRRFDQPLETSDLRPAKGVHIAIRRDRLHADAAVAIQAADKRNMFLCPYGDVHVIGTTDTFTTRIDRPTVDSTEVDYLLEAANRAFPDARLTPADVVTVWAGVRPLVAEPGDVRPPSSVSREHRITKDRSGLISMAGGKLTTFRVMAEELVDQALEQLPSSRRRELKPCRTKDTPLREDDFDRDELESELAKRFGIESRRADRLIRAWGAKILVMLEGCDGELREPIGDSEYTYAEVTWALAHECAAGLSDILDHRLRMTTLSPGQGLSELDRIAAVAATVGDWSPERMEREVETYRDLVKTHYQVNS